MKKERMKNERMKKAGRAGIAAVLGMMLLAVSVNIQAASEKAGSRAGRDISGTENEGVLSSTLAKEKVGRPKIKVKNYGEDDRRLKISWSPVTGADGYFVYRSKTKAGSYELVNWTETSTSFVDTRLDPATTYYYKVRAFRYQSPGERYRSWAERIEGADSKVAWRKTKQTVYDESVFDSALLTDQAGSKPALTIRSASAANAQKVYSKLRKGKSFTVRVKAKNSKSAENIMEGLVKKVRKLSDVCIGFEYQQQENNGKTYIYRIDGLSYKYVRKYILMACKERMAEYKIFIDSGRNLKYYDEYDGLDGYHTSFYTGNFRENPFECAYGTPFAKMSTESRLLFVTPGTSRVCRCDYMVYSNERNVGFRSSEMFIRLCNKTAKGVCAHFSAVTQRLCRYLGIECWGVADSTFDHAWTIVKVRTEKGRTAYYLVDNSGVGQLTSEDMLKEGEDHVWDYTAATKIAMGKDYPWR